MVLTWLKHLIWYLNQTNIQIQNMNLKINVKQHTSKLEIMYGCKYKNVEIKVWRSTQYIGLHFFNFVIFNFADSGSASVWESRQVCRLGVLKKLYTCSMVPVVFFTWMISLKWDKTIFKRWLVQWTYFTELTCSQPLASQILNIDPQFVQLIYYDNCHICTSCTCQRNKF